MKYVDQYVTLTSQQLLSHMLNVELSSEIVHGAHLHPRSFAVDNTDLEVGRHYSF